MANESRAGRRADADDFPYYDRQPVELSVRQWWFVLGAVAIGFAALTVPIPLFATPIGQFIPAILFPAIPLIALAIVTPRHWTALFRPIRRRDIAWMLGAAFLNVVVSLAIGLVFTQVHETNANRSITGLAHLGNWQRVLFYLKTIPHLFGEELLTILPFLALMYAAFSRLHLSRRTSIVLAWLLSAVLFAAAHLPTYGWNVVQCLVVIGSARLVLSLPYMATKNIWSSAGAHILNDWIFFTMTILGARAAGAASLW